MQTPLSTTAAAGDHTVIPARAGHQIVITGGLFVAAATTSMTFNSGGTTLSGAIPLDTNAGFALSHNTSGWIHGETGQPISIETDAAASVVGWINYTYRPVTFGAQVFSAFRSEK